MSVIAIPCRYILVHPDKYHSCSLLGGVCQALNYNLTDITVKLVVKPSERRFTGNPDEGTFEATITDYESEVLSVERPENDFDLDAQCPAGYTWDQVKAKIDALDELIPEGMNDMDAERISAMIRNMHETNIMEAEK